MASAKKSKHNDTMLYIFTVVDKKNLPSFWPKTYVEISWSLVCVCVCTCTISRGIYNSCVYHLIFNLLIFLKVLYMFILQMGDGARENHHRFYKQIQIHVEVSFGRYWADDSVRDAVTTDRWQTTARAANWHWHIAKNKQINKWSQHEPSGKLQF